MKEGNKEMKRNIRKEKRGNGEWESKDKKRKYGKGKKDYEKVNIL